MVSTLKIAAILLTLGPLAGILGIPYCALVHDITPLYRVALHIIRLALKAGGIQVVILGDENIPTGRACIFMANHVSNLDPPVLIPALPIRTSVLLKRELMRIPILGAAMRMAGYIPVDRGHRRDAAAASVNAAADAIHSGLHMLIFPEGTRSPDGRLRPFKRGPFFLAEQTLAPIVPIAISGTERMMRKGSFAIHPGVAQVQFLPSIDPAAYPSREAIAQAVQTAIAEALPRHMQP